MFTEGEIMRNKIIRWALIFTAMVTLATISLPAFAQEASSAQDKAGPDLPGILAGLLIIAGLGFALGCFGLVVNHIFYRRSLIAYIFLTKKPGLSLLTGIIITLVVLGLLAILSNVPQLQGIILIISLLGLGIITLGCVSRLGAHIVEPQIIEDELPGAWAYIKGGLVLMAMNIVLIVGNIFFIGVLLTGAGATLLSYFAGAASMPQGPWKKRGSTEPTEIPMEEPE